MHHDGITTESGVAEVQQYHWQEALGFITKVFGDKQAIFRRAALTSCDKSVMVPLSRPSSKAGRLSYADSPRPLSPWEEKPGSAECYWTGVSYPTSQGPGHRYAQPEVQYLIPPHIQCAHSKFSWPLAQFHVGHSVLLRIFLTVALFARSRSVSGASTGLSSSPLSSPRVRACWPAFNKLHA